MLTHRFIATSIVLAVTGAVQAALAVWGWQGTNPTTLPTLLQFALGGVMLVLAVVWWQRPQAQVAPPHAQHTHPNIFPHDMAMGMLCVDTHGVITAAHGQSIAQIAQVESADVLLGQKIEVALAHHPAFVASSRLALAGNITEDILEIGGATYDLHFCPHYTVSGTVAYPVFITAVDITDKRIADEALQRYTMRLETLHEMDKAILKQAAPPELAKTILEHLPSLLPCVAGCVLLYNRACKIEHLVFRWYSGELSLLPLAYFDNHQLTLFDAQKIDSTQMTTVPIEGTEDALLLQLLAHLGAAHLTIKPIVQDGLLNAVLLVGSEKPTNIIIEDQNVLQELGNVLEFAIKQLNLTSKLNAHTRFLETDLIHRVNEVYVVKRRSEAILQNSSDAIALTKHNGDVIETNPAFLRMFGYITAPNEDEPLPLHELIDQSEQAKLDEAMATAIQQQKPQYANIRMKRGSGERFTTSIAVCPIMSLFNDADGLVLSMRDISELIRIEEELRNALRREREISKLRSRFVSTVSHEFRTPLTVIRSSVEILQTFLERNLIDAPDRVNMHIERSLQATYDMQGLLQDVTNVQEVNNIHQLTDTQPVKVMTIVQQIVGTVHLTTAHSHTIDIVCVTPVPTMDANPKLLRQIISNLVMNATKYSAPGSTIEIRIFADDGSVSVQVTDNGIGIPVEEQKHILEPFYRAANVSTQQGSGLGLAIVKQAVDLHSGTISFESTLGQGSQFVVTLPVKQQIEVIESIGEAHG